MIPAPLLGSRWTILSTMGCRIELWTGKGSGSIKLLIMMDLGHCFLDTAVVIGSYGKSVRLRVSVLIPSNITLVGLLLSSTQSRLFSYGPVSPPNCLVVA